MRAQGWRRGRRRISGQRLRLIEKLKGQGLSNVAIAHRLGVTEKAIRKVAVPSQGEEFEQRIRLAKYTVDGGAKRMREVFSLVSLPPRLWA